jgi:hypothetical protein
MINVSKKLFKFLFSAEGLYHPDNRKDNLFRNLLKCTNPADNAYSKLAIHISSNFQPVYA